MILAITGISGSLGKSILKHQDILKKHGITKIRGLSRDEQKQISLMKDYEGTIPLDCYLGDVTDRRRMKFALNDAHFVIHAAAQKHIDKFELDIPVGYKNNIIGTQNVGEGFLKSRNAVSGIFVSTDKAVTPITSYGISKLASEHLWQWFNTFQKQVKFGSCRYGNVFGSRGSVIESWTKLAKQKKTLPITHKDCTRFFIMIEDASRFVLQSLFNNKPETHIPSMKACKMTTLAEVIWSFHNPSDECLIQDVGLRNQEKLHEILQATGPSSQLVEQFSMDELRLMYKDWYDQNYS